MGFKVFHIYALKSERQQVFKLNKHLELVRHMQYMSIAM